VNRQQSRAEQSRAEQSRAEQSRAEQSRAPAGRNVKHSFVALTLLLVACSGHDADEAAHMQAALASACERDVLLQQRQHFEYAGVSVVHQVCRPKADEPPEIVTLDERTGESLDLEAVVADDTAAFRNAHSTLDAATRAKLDASGGGAIEVDVWFRVDISDFPDKEWQVAEPGAAEALKAEHERRLLSTARALRARLGELRGVELVSHVDGKVEYGMPTVRIRAARAALDVIGTWPEVWRIMHVPRGLPGSAEDYIATERRTHLTAATGLIGAGQTVAVMEGWVPDSWAELPGAPAGNCPDSLAVNRKCHCVGGSGSEWGNHPRWVMGVIRRANDAGMAPGATTIMANHQGGCTTHGPDTVSSALNWATANYATAITNTEGTYIDAGGPLQTSYDMFHDYVASAPPWPTIVGTAGNIDPADNQMLNMRLRNGLVVGGAQENAASDRSQVVLWSGSRWQNPGESPAGGFELPHLVAIATNVTTIGWPNASGTSVAVPQVAGIVATLQEGNASLRGWPEVVLPGLMASADEDVDGIELDLNSGIDHRDGAGLVNAYRAWSVLKPAAKVNGGNVPVSAAHDYGTMSVYTTPAGSFYVEEYFARVPNGRALRVASLLQSRPTCPSNPGSWSCTANPYPYQFLFLYDGTSMVRWSPGVANNYTYIHHVNTSGVQKDYKIKIYLYGWNGLSSTTFGIAWNALAPY
jgi:hypothetical protein